MTLKWKRCEESEREREAGRHVNFNFDEVNENATTFSENGV
jgi:hypothetical protein